MPKPMRVGIIGCGAISGAYLKYGKQLDTIEYAACADLLLDAAKKKAAEFDIPKACTVDELLADESIDIVLNLTIPKAHTKVSLAAIAAGKHVYNEKPLGINRAEGKQIIDAAKAKGLRVGCAPDTFFGAGHQTARKLIDDGAIGKPVAVVAFMLCAGHESWHPNPEFYYEVGGGPMFDMGPYYLTDMIQLLGPIRRVTGSTAVAITPRTISHDKSGKLGKKINVETPDHIAGTIEFANGAVGTIITSFAVKAHTLPHIQIYGTDGTLQVPDPNGFDGEVKIKTPGDEDWRLVPHTHPIGYGRAAGLADMAQAIAAGRPHRASGDLSFMVLDAMQGFLEAGETGKAIDLAKSDCQPAPLSPGHDYGKFDG
jgi:predicted dehydrogenase